jgi:hypothetical protein
MSARRANMLVLMGLRERYLPAIVPNYPAFRKRNDSCLTLFKFKKSGEFFVGPHYKSAINAPK